MTEEGCIDGTTTAEIHHVDNCRLFGGNDTREVELRCLWAHFGVSGHLHTHRSHDQVIGNQRASKKMTPQWPSVTTRSGSARHSRLAWVPLCFMAHLPWSTEEGRATVRDGRRRVVWCLKTTRPMRDGRLAYFQCARHNPAALRHDVLDGPGTQRGEVCRISTEEFCRNRTRVPCCNTRQTRAVRHKLAVNISLVVGGPRCPSQHKFCQKQKSRNAKIHIRQNG